MWERLGWHRTVARYCRIMVAAEKPGAPAAVMSQATALEDRLGLNPKAMRLMLWTIVKDELADRREGDDQEHAEQTPPPAPPAHIRAVDSSGA